LLIAIFSGYLTRAIVQPVRRAAGMADRLATGDLHTRMPPDGVAEIGGLQRSFNAMAGSLEEQRDELSRLAGEQAALRRVATPVARGAPQPLLFAAATDQTRRRIERDLHDGVQQRLVSLALELRGAEALVPAHESALRDRLAAVGSGLTGALEDLREISRGIHPAILSEGGLRPALGALARRSAVPVELDVTVDARLPQPVEVAASYAGAEALTNAAKPARPSVVHRGA